MEHITALVGNGGHGWEYVCSQPEPYTHRLYSPHNPLTKCVGMVDGKACPGTLKQVGAGSRTQAKAPESIAAATAKLPVADQRRLRPQAPRR